MATLRMKDIQKMDAKDLKKKENELRLELAKERANIGIGASSSSPGRMKEIRRTIARLQTVMAGPERQSKQAEKGSQ